MDISPEPRRVAAHSKLKINICLINKGKKKFQGSSPAVKRIGYHPRLRAFNLLQEVLHLYITIVNTQKLNILDFRPDNLESSRS